MQMFNLIDDINQYENRHRLIQRDLYDLPILQELQIRDTIEKELPDWVVAKRCKLRSNEPWFWAIADKWR